ncbi:MAG TPA: tetratricopeptide repeat protein [Nitrososphaeraceae archaeon]
MGRFFKVGRKEVESSDSMGAANELGSKRDYREIQSRDLYNKGINHMSNDKLQDAIRCFELSLRIDPQYVDAWIKKGYAHFHLEEYNLSIASYDKALDIDLGNSEAWNLKGLAYYKMNNYEKAIECSDKAIDADPNDGMSWYNRACYLTLSDRVDEGMEALRRAIEIDVSHAKKAVRDKDFENARAEEGFMRIIEVVALESVRQGYDYAGKIVWITGMNKEDVEDALLRLEMKGLVVKKEKKGILGKEAYYELAKGLSEKIGEVKRSGFLSTRKEFLAPVQEIKEILESLDKAVEEVKNGNLALTLEALDQLISPVKHGNTLIEQFFEQHRDLRLFRIRLENRGQEYLISHKSEILQVLTNIIERVRQNPVSKTIDK